VIDKTNIDKTNAWPFVEAKKLLRERKKILKTKGKLSYKQDMALVVYPILVHSVKWQELR